MLATSCTPSGQEKPQLQVMAPGDAAAEVRRVAEAEGIGTVMTQRAAIDGMAAGRLPSGTMLCPEGRTITLETRCRFLPDAEFKRALRIANRR